jgi:hypothetical protein
VSDTLLHELRTRDPMLFWTGMLMAGGLVICTLLSIGDSRLILGINPWIKPMKFMTSITIFLWTTAWFMRETRDVPKPRAIVRHTTATAMVLEAAIIILQSARGTTSHFNQSSVTNSMLFALMGLMITVNTAVMCLFLWILRRDTPPSRAGYLWGMRIGVAMFLLASLQGFVLVANNTHTVGAPDGGPGLPFVNWSTSNGDLRIAHFFGMHAMQALPLLGFVVDRGAAATGPGLRRNIVVGAGILWLAVMGALLNMALQGRPLLAL